MSLLQLPNELLLDVIGHLAFLPRYRRRELVALSVVCKRLNGVVTESLHNDLCVSIYGLAQVLEVYVQKPELAQKVRSLELFHELRPGWTVDVKRGITEGVQISEMDFKCFGDIIRRSSLSETAKQEFLNDLGSRDHTTVFALAIVMLPNIHQLLLGTFASNKVDIIKLFQRHDQRSAPPKLYLSEAFKTRAPHITTLELPYHHPWSGGPPAHPAICSNLQALTLNMHALIGYGDRFQEGGMPIWLYASLPSSLRKLTIGHPLIRHLFNLSILQHLTDARASGTLPHLAQLEIYMNDRDPAGNNTAFYNPQMLHYTEEAYPKQIIDFVKHMGKLGVVATFHWSDQVSIFSPLTCSVSESCYSAEALRAVELRGVLEHMRPKAEELGRKWQEEENAKREKRHRERRERGEDSDTSDGEMCGYQLYD